MKYKSMIFFTSIIVLLFQSLLVTSKFVLLSAITVFLITISIVSYVIKFLYNNEVTDHSKNWLQTLLISITQIPYNLYNGSKTEVIEKKCEKLNYCGINININNEMKTIARLITKNYISFWYNTISGGSNEFINDCHTILQQFFVNFIDKCQKNLNTEVVIVKTLNLIQNHIIINRNLFMNVYCDSYINEYNSEISKENIKEMVEKIVILCAPNQIKSVFHSDSNETNQLSLFIMIKEMLTESVFIPIINIISEPTFIYSNIYSLLQQTNDQKMIEILNSDETDSKADYSQRNTRKMSCINVSSLNASESNSDLMNVELVQQTITNPSVNYDHYQDQQHNDLIDMNRCTNDYEDDFESNILVNAIEAEDIDMKLFTNIRITKTINASNYTLYCIEYEALFKETDQQLSFGEENPYLISLRKSFAVNRRFSEFLRLQTSLEQNDIFRKIIKDIKKPSSIKITSQNFLIFSGSKLDDSTIEFRRKYLSHFLNKLCCHESIACSNEMQHFLAYGCDANTEFVKSKSATLKPIYKGVKEAISLIKTALPVEPQIGQIDCSDGAKVPYFNYNHKFISKLIFKVDDNNIMQLEKKLSNFIIKKADENSTLLSEEQLGERSRGDGCEAHETIIDLKQPQQNATNLFSMNQLLNIIILFVTNNSIFVWHIITAKIGHILFGSIFSKILNNWIEKMRYNGYIIYIHKLHTAIWPHKVYNKVVNVTYEQLVLEIGNYYENNLMHPLINIVPKKITFQLISNILHNLNSCKRNKLFIYDFIQLIINEIEGKN